MHPLSITVLVLMCYLATARFACGNDEVQANFAEVFVKNDCKDRMKPLDRCCYAHIKCYLAGKKQVDCDNILCKCTSEVAKGMASCETHATNFCNNAKTFGGLRYERLKNEGKQMKLNKQ